MDREDLESAKQNGKSTSSLDEPRTVLVILFFVAGVLGVPLLWISRGFSTGSKIALTILVSLYTLLILWVFWLVMVWCYQRILSAW